MIYSAATACDDEAATPDGGLPHSPRLGTPLQAALQRGFRRSGGIGDTRQRHGYPAVLGAIGFTVIRRQRVTLAMKAQGNLLSRPTIGFQILHHRQGAAPRQVAIGQAIAAVVGMPVELDAIDRSEEHTSEL